MKKPFMLISVLPMTAHISNDADTAGDRTGRMPEEYAFKNKVLRLICFIFWLLYPKSPLYLHRDQNRKR